MRHAAFLAAMLTGCAAPPAASGGGIVSLNPCADAMLVALVPPQRIAALSRYSFDPATSSIAPETAARYRPNYGTAEEIIALKPDLVVGDSFTSPSTRAAIARAGVRTLYLGSTNSIAASKAQVSQLAEVAGVRARGETLNRAIDRAVAEAHSDAAPIAALLWVGGNMVSGGGTLLDEMMVRAGFRDQAAHYGLRFTGYLPMERVIADPPRVMLVPEQQGRDASSRAAQLRARALSHLGVRVHQARFPRRLVNCGGPVIVPAMRRLTEVRRAVTS